jgi:SAM-dependent methyltransferase
MKQTPIHFDYNPDLLQFMPPDLTRVVEVGCSSGALAKAYAAINPSCRYTGIEIDPEFAETARGACGEVLCGNIEQFDDATFDTLFPSDCWVFGDVLEHLYDPWAVLKRIRARLAPNGRVVACVPNVQHWSVQVRLNAGMFRYEDSGLMDRTHIRWFTRLSLLELFESCGYKVTGGIPRILRDPDPERFLAAVRAMAQAVGRDPEQAAKEAIVFQWVVCAAPA